MPKTRFTLTQNGYDELKLELAQLQEKRPSLVAKLSEARDLGDRSENGYYKEARAGLSSLDARVAHITSILKQAAIAPDSPTGVTNIGSKVSVMIGEHKKDILLVGDFEANPSENKISVRSPLGRALLGKRVGEEATVQTPSGTKRIQLLNVS